MRLWKKIGLIFLALIIVCVSSVVAVGWMLGASTSLESDASIKKSPQYGDGKFVNIEPEAKFEITWEQFERQFFGEEQREPLGTIPVVSINADRFKEPPAPGLRMAWFGHATVLVEIDGKRILTDPIFAERASPVSFAGPKRFHPTPIRLEDLSGIDAVLISHNHYDHLDKATALHLAQQGTRFHVPLGNKPDLIAWGVPKPQIEEMDWWQEVELGELKIVATPSRHYSSRGLFDFQKTLWASWSVIGPDNRFFFSGDTGYSKVFTEIGKRFGPFDATIVKVGSYGPGTNWHDIHMPPEEAIQVHKDVRGSVMLPVHWGTFNLAYHRWDEPIIRSVRAAKVANVNLATPKVGEIVDVNRANQSNSWWQEVD